MTKKTTMTTKTDTELTKLLTDSRAELRSLRFAAAGARPKDSNAPKKLRATIARIHTEVTARASRIGTSAGTEKTA